MNIWKIIGNVLSLGTIPIIRAIAKARRERREQEHRHRIERAMYERECRERGEAEEAAGRG